MIRVEMLDGLSGDLAPAVLEAAKKVFGEPEDEVVVHVYEREIHVFFDDEDGEHVGESPRGGNWVADIEDAVRHGVAFC